MATVNDALHSAALGGPTAQYDALRQVAAAVARGTDTSALFTLVAERTAELLGADGAGVVRFLPDGTGRLVGQWRHDDLMRITAHEHVDLNGESAVAQVFRTGRPARIDDYAVIQDRRSQFLANVYRAGAAAPILGGMGVWGALAVGVRAPTTFGPDAERILEDFAGLVALAVVGVDPASRAASDALLDTLLSSAPVSIAFLDRDLRLVRANTAFAEISGLRADAHAGRAPAEEPHRYPHVDLDLAARVLRGEPASIDVERTGIPFGHSLARHWLTSYYPVASDTGDMFGVGVVAVDITGQRQAVEALRHERDYSAALIGAMNDGLAVIASDGTLTDVSVRLCEMTGFARHELVGSAAPYPFWGAGDDSTRAETAFTRVRAGVGTVETVLRRRDGRALPVLLTHAPMQGADGAEDGSVITIRDITDLHRAEEERTKLFAAERAARNRTEILQQVSAALSKALTPEHVLETIITSTVPLLGAVGGMVLLDHDGTLAPVPRQDRRMRLVVSPQQLRIEQDSALTRVARLGVPAFFKSRRALAEVDPVLEAAVRADAESVCAVQIARHGRSLGTLALGFPDQRMFATEDRTLLVTIGDVFAQALDRARLYDAARARADAFRQRDTLRRAVLRGVSHEFRSPLTAISNAADALARVEDVTLRQELLDLIGTETRRLDRFVANVLDLSRLEGGALTPNLDSCSAAEIVAGALEAVDALVGKIGVRVDLPDDLPFIRADPVLTERILLNLIHNAARHGGPTIELQIRHVEESVWFVVIDDGPGVPTGLRRTIFEPFVGQRERGGLGLGLGLSRGLAQAQSGDLWLDAGRAGTRFVVSLPVDRPEDR